MVPNRLAPDRLAEQLQPWATATLRAGGYGFGRYYAALCLLDEDDEPSRAIRQESIDWSGTTVLYPAPTEPAPPPGLPAAPMDRGGTRPGGASAATVG